MRDPWEPYAATYCGDGVYAWRDAYNTLWLATARGFDWHTIALERETFAAVIQFAERHED
jgi:hypothetical protein